MLTSGWSNDLDLLPKEKAVTPAKAGPRKTAIRSSLDWIPAFAGMTETGPRYASVFEQRST